MPVERGFAFSGLLTHAGKAGMKMQQKPMKSKPTGAENGKQESTGKGIPNKKVRDSSSKIIFGDSVLCCQFLKGYVDIPLLKEVEPEDIEDVSERYVHMFVEERNSDVVKKVHLKHNKMPFFLVSLIEHKSHVDYNVVIQILRYIICIWEDYEKEQEKEHPGISRTKEFKYPPVLPIIYYDGSANWTAASELKERVFLSELLEEYLPNFKCILVQLKDYSSKELMEKKDELSIILLISRLQKAEDFGKIGKEVSEEYVKEVTSESPEYLLEIMSQVVEVLLRKINVPYKEAEAFAGQVKERRMGELFANFEAYDVQETRRVSREEGREAGRKEGIKLVVENMLKKGIPDVDVMQLTECSQELIAEVRCNMQ